MDYIAVSYGGRGNWKAHLKKFHEMQHRDINARKNKIQSLLKDKMKWSKKV